MKTRLLSAAAAALMLTGCSLVSGGAPRSSGSTGPAAAPNIAPAQRLAYPPSAKGNVVDDYHGTKVADPYRWLENDSAQTRAWVRAQNALTFDYLEKLPARARLQQRLSQLWNYERFGVPSREGRRYVFTRNAGLQDQPVLYVSDTLEGKPRVLLDPNTLSRDGTVALRDASSPPTAT